MPRSKGQSKALAKKEETAVVRAEPKEGMSEVERIISVDNIPEFRCATCLLKGSCNYYDEKFVCILEGAAQKIEITDIKSIEGAKKALVSHMCRSTYMAISREALSGVPSPETFQKVQQTLSALDGLLNDAGRRPADGGDKVSVLNQILIGGDTVGGNVPEVKTTVRKVKPDEKIIDV